MQYSGEMVGLMLEELFDDTLLNQVYGKLTEGKVEEGMGPLFNGLQLRRQNSSDQEWAEFVSMCLHHPIKELVHQDPFTKRAFSKPRGYAGDAVLLDYIYGREERWALPEGTSELGQQIFHFTTSATASEGVRARREFIANLLDKMVDEGKTVPTSSRSPRGISARFSSRRPSAGASWAGTSRSTPTPAAWRRFLNATHAMASKWPPPRSGNCSRKRPFRAILTSCTRPACTTTSRP